MPWSVVVRPLNFTVRRQWLQAMVTRFRPLKILVLLCGMAFLAALIRFNYLDHGAHSGLLTAVIFVLLYALIAAGVIPLPQGTSIPFFTVWPRLTDAVKAVVSFLLIFLWTPIGMRLTPDSPMGVAILLAPDALFLLAALVYLSNGLSRNP